MPSNVGGSVSARMAKMSREVSRASRTAVERAAFAAKAEQVAEIERVVPDKKMSGVGRNGARVGARYDVKGIENATGLVRAIGPVHLLENPVKPHDITPRSKRRGGKRAVATPAGPRAKVQHPGVRNPRKPWSKGLAKARPKVRREIERAYTAAFRRGATR